MQSNAKLINKKLPCAYGQLFLLWWIIVDDGSTRREWLAAKQK